MPARSCKSLHIIAYVFPIIIAKPWRICWLRAFNTNRVKLPKTRLRPKLIQMLVIMQFSQLIRVWPDKPSNVWAPNAVLFSLMKQGVDGSSSCKKAICIAAQQDISRQPPAWNTVEPTKWTAGRIDAYLNIASSSVSLVDHSLLLFDSVSTLHSYPRQEDLLSRWTTFEGHHVKRRHDKKDAHGRY
jgi:hypothetical protein